MYNNTFYVSYKKPDIKHHGIKGQRWGIRRYQNPDGTLTAEGKARYGSELQKTMREADAARARYKTMPRGFFSPSFEQHSRQYLNNIGQKDENAYQDYYDNINADTKSKILESAAMAVENGKKASEIRNDSTEAKLFRTTKTFYDMVDHDGNYDDDLYDKEFAKYLSKQNPSKGKKYNKYVADELKYTKQRNELIDNHIKNTLGEDWFNTPFYSKEYKYLSTNGKRLSGNLINRASRNFW